MNVHLFKRVRARGRAIAGGELVRVLVEVYWSVAFAPLYQLLKFTCTGAASGARPASCSTSSSMNQTLDLVVKALTPPAGAALARPAAKNHSADHLATHSAARSSKHPEKKVLS